RFLLYAVQPFAIVPARPLSMIGYVDLTDQTTPSAAVLGVAIVGTTGPTPVAYASYTLSRLVGQSAGASLAGFVSDGVTRLDLAGRPELRRRERRPAHAGRPDRAQEPVHGLDQPVRDGLLADGAGAGTQPVRA